MQKYFRPCTSISKNVVEYSKMEIEIQGKTTTFTIERLDKNKKSCNCFYKLWDNDTDYDWKFGIIQRFFFISNDADDPQYFAYFSGLQLNQIQTNVENFCWSGSRTTKILFMPVRWIEAKLVSYQLSGNQQYSICNPHSQM
jgi:hypothetical protein